MGLIALIATTLQYSSRRWRTFVPLSAFHQGPADDYELAMLTGGPDLVVLVALMNLESRGALELARVESRLPRLEAGSGPRPSIVASIGSLEPGGDPLEAAVYRAVAAGNETEKQRIGAELSVARALDDRHRRLVANGLLVDPALVPQELAEHPSFQNLNPRTLLGNELVRRLRKSHPGESVGTLVALFGPRMLAKVDAGLARARARATPCARRNGFLAPCAFGGDAGNMDAGGTW